MTEVQTIEIKALHAMTILPRIALVFCRRRIAVRHMEMVTDDNNGYAQIRLVAACDVELGRKVVKHIARIVEVRSVELRSADGFASESINEPDLQLFAAASATG